MEKTGEMDLYLYVDGRGRMTMPRALRCRTGMGKNSFVRARLDGGVVRLTHVTPREAAQMTEEELLDFIRASLPLSLIHICCGRRLAHISGSCWRCWGC